MHRFVYACLMGAVFGAGLVMAGMTNPDNIKGFLDVAGQWRPQLLAVLGTAVITAGLLFAVARKLGSPMAAEQFHWPTRRDLDIKLIGGSALFGTGWALAGYCPGPALVALGSASVEAWMFVPAMAAGMWLVKRFQ